MGISGSILVFRQELSSVGQHWPSHGSPTNLPVEVLPRVLKNVRAAYPGFHVVSITAPTESSPIYMTLLQSRTRFSVASDAVTGEVLGQIRRVRTWVDSVATFHESLFAHRTGRILNGVGGIVLLIMWATGLVIWWPGIAHWRRGIRVDFRRRWRRINFDLHSAVAFWSSVFLLIWGVTGVYFAWPDQVSAAIAQVSAVRSARPPVIMIESYTGAQMPPLAQLLGRTTALDPGTKFGGISFPFSRRSPLEIIRRRPGGTGREYEDRLYFNPLDGSYLGIWRYGVNQSVGDWLVWAQVPFHFGTSWGILPKVIWFLAGLSLPILAVTGLLMYWNRYLRQRWHKLRWSPGQS